jgi:transposase InsO family protein
LDNRFRLTVLRNDERPALLVQLRGHGVRIPNPSRHASQPLGTRVTPVDECLNEHWFIAMAQTRRAIEALRIEYDTGRPHSSLGELTPEEFARRTLKADTDSVF